MRKFFCDICRRETAVEERLVRIGIPTPGILDEEHSMRLMDVCRDCAEAIDAAIIAAEVEAYESIVAAACQSADESSDLPDDWDMPHSYYGDEDLEDDT